MSWGATLRAIIARHQRKLVASALLGAMIGGLLLVDREQFNLQALAQHEAQLRAYQREHPAVVYAVAFVVYVVIAGFSLPGAIPLSLASGWLFGFWPGLVFVSFASTGGATVAFLLSRYLLRDWVQRRFGARLETVNAALRRDGPFYLFLLRLTPAVPFFVINVLMGVTPLKVSTFWWVSQLAMLPITALVVNTGARLPSLAQVSERGLQGVITPQLVVALVLLGLVPLVIRRVLHRRAALEGRPA